jgi:hypothetical protein
MNRFVLTAAAALLGPAAAPAQSPAELPQKELAAFRARLLAATTKHLDGLLGPGGKVDALKGKGTDGATALAYYQAFEVTGDPKYRAAAVALADRIVADMRATKHGVLYIKEKGSGDDAIPGGGPPALGWYASAAAYILHKEGGKDADVKYVATVIDNYPWNPDGWWANAIDVKTGQPKEPLTKAGAINKSAAMAMCAGTAAMCVRKLDPELSARLKAKADACVYKQILPAQEADGFWHYGFKGTDPKNKDVLGYFMVTTHALVQLQALTGGYQDRAFRQAVDKAGGFAAKHIAPMTDPNPGPAPRPARATDGTPKHYSLADEHKRGFQLGVVLFAGGDRAGGAKVLDAALKHFPFGDAGADGGHAAGPSALVLSLFPRDGAKKE